MSAFFRLGLGIVGPLGPFAKTALVAAFFLAPALLLAWRGAGEPWVLGAAAALFALATYLQASIVLSAQLGVLRIRRTVERIALGELKTSEQLRQREGEDAGGLWEAIGKMSGNLTEIVQQVRNSCEVIDQSAKDVADGYANLAQRTEEQAATLEETASGMETLSTTVKQNADNCRRASGLASETSGVAAASSDWMRRVTASMQRMEQQSKKVAEIIGLIEGIAFQTNILALNAAVEAARAGAQGRGFAVVASEVRALAQRSADAAKEIKALVRESVATVADGARLVDEAAKEIDRAVERVQTVSSVIGEIATASAEQSSGVEEIGKAIAQLEKVTQQNAGLVEGATAATLSFEKEAQRLKYAVSAFKLDHADAREKAVALVEKGIAYVKAHGTQRAFDAFEDRRGPFVSGDYYLFAFDRNGIRAADGSGMNQRGVGIVIPGDRGSEWVWKQFSELGFRRGKGWLDYPTLNPATGQNEQKSTYIEGAGDYLVGCGFYTGAAELSPRRRREARTLLAKPPARALRSPR
jgi:methyl-accepting chemotaxis protein